MGKDGSVSAKERGVMPEDAPVNTGAVGWPDPGSAAAAVRGMQIKLHRWASADGARRFGDLFNLVYDPGVPGARVEAGVGQRRGEDPGSRSGHGGLDRVPDRGRGVPGPATGVVE